MAQLAQEATQPVTEPGKNQRTPADVAAIVESGYAIWEINLVSGSGSKYEIDSRLLRPAP